MYAAIVVDGEVSLAVDRISRSCLGYEANAQQSDRRGNTSGEAFYPGSTSYQWVGIVEVASSGNYSRTEVEGYVRMVIIHFCMIWYGNTLTM
jgi:hypothetical protein